MAITYPTTIDSFSSKTDNVDDVQAVDINDVQDAIEALETKVGSNSSAVEASIDYKVNTFLLGRKIWIYENVAPSGWNIVASTTDAVIACKGGSQAYNSTGGQQLGTWTQPSHTLTVSEMPEHRHEAATGNFAVVVGSGGDAPFTGGSTVDETQYTTNVGGDGSHNHGTTYRPLANVGIIIEKT